MSESVETVKEKVTTRKKKMTPPKKYNVVIVNDNVTTVEFVIALLISVFKKDELDAVKLTAEVHQKGFGVAGTYDFEIAEQKVIDSTRLARENGFPLVTKMEPLA